MPRHVCLFDIDGTLLLTGGAGKAAIQAALAAEFNLEWPARDISLHGRTDRGVFQELFACCNLDDCAEHLDRLRRAYLAQLPRWLAAFPGRVLPGVVELLGTLEQLPAIAVGLLTGNMQAGAALKLQHFRLERYFSFGGYGDDHADRCAVAAEALAAARRQFGAALDPKDVWVIGDTPHDIRCARAIGARAVAVATGGCSVEELSRHAPDVVLPDFQAAATLIDRWR